jgi:hypothetical protein
MEVFRFIEEAVDTNTQQREYGRERIAQIGKDTEEL